jgi:hypothetical protein
MLVWRLIDIGTMIDISMCHRLRVDSLKQAGNVSTSVLSAGAVAELVTGKGGQVISSFSI